MSRTTTSLALLSLLTLLALQSAEAEEQVVEPELEESQLWVAEPTDLKSAAAPFIEISSTLFGSIRYKNGDIHAFKPNPDNTIDLTKSDHYGWAIVMKSNKKIVKWKEELFLADGAAKESALPDSEQPLFAANDAPGRLLKVTERNSRTDRVYNDITTSRKLGPGHYIVRVTIEGEATLFDFNLVR